MSLRPYRLLKTVPGLVAVMAITMLVGFSVVASPATSPASNGLMTTNTSRLSASELYYAQKGQELIEAQQAHTTALAPQGASGDEPFYVILGVLDLAGYVVLYRLARQQALLCPKGARVHERTANSCAIGREAFDHSHALSQICLRKPRERSFET